MTLLLWFAVKNRVTSKVFLTKRNIIPGSSTLCSIWKLLQEDANHIFIHCHKTFLLWSSLLSWWGCYFCAPDSLDDLIHQWNRLVKGKIQNKFWMILFMSAIWSLWLSRNDENFNSNVYRNLHFSIRYSHEHAFGLTPLTNLIAWKGKS